MGGGGGGGGEFGEHDRRKSCLTEVQPRATLAS